MDGLINAIVIVVLMSVIILLNYNCLKKHKRRSFLIETDVWELKNPPKYKIGESISEKVYGGRAKGIVVSRNVCGEKYDKFYYAYGVFNGLRIDTFVL